MGPHVVLAPIAAIHDFGRIDGTTFAVTELLEGEILRAALIRGTLPLSRALDVAAQVAEAVGAAHESGLVHRDLKLSNVFPKMCAAGEAAGWTGSEY